MRLLIALFLIAPVYAERVAFPGALGFGRFSEGPRLQASPDVCRVSNLNDTGEGSLRACFDGDKDDRYIVFQTCGQIDLADEDNISLTGEYVYVAGQSCPSDGDGITVAGAAVFLSGSDATNNSDIIFRHVRVKHDPNGGASTGQGLGIGVQNCNNCSNVQDIIIDHASVMFQGSDEAGWMWNQNGRIDRVTWQYVLFYENRGGVFTNCCNSDYLGPTNITQVYTVHAAGITRIPAMLRGGPYQMAGITVYRTYGGATETGGPQFGPYWAIWEYNYNKRAVTASGIQRNMALVQAAPDESWYSYRSLMSAKGSMMYNTRESDDQRWGPICENACPDNVANKGTWRQQAGGNYGRFPSYRYLPLYGPDLSITDASTAHAAAISQTTGAGTNLPALDSDDLRILQEVATGTAFLGTTLTEGDTSYPTLSAGTAWPDTEESPTCITGASACATGDGMDDNWEDTNCTSHDTCTPHGDEDSDGWTNIEEWLNNTDPEDPDDPGDINPPDAPTLSLIGINGDTVTLSWTEAATTYTSLPATKYYILRGFPGYSGKGIWMEIAETVYGRTATIPILSKQRPMARYPAEGLSLDFAVVAVNANGESDWSNAVTVDTALLGWDVEYGAY